MCYFDWVIKAVVDLKDLILFLYKLNHVKEQNTENNRL